LYLSNEKPETYREDTESKIVIFWNIRVKFVLQYPVECVDISKHFYTFVVFLRGQTYYWWKCFAFILDRESGKFMCTRI